MAVHLAPGFVSIVAWGPSREDGIEGCSGIRFWQGEAMAAVVGWWGSTRGSPRADLKQERGSEVVCMGPGRAAARATRARSFR